ncbi:hypothetical protein FRC03_006165 [Tulasnella sp. 419]|nr:hypothetical protein FRC03_006165 [Tulasnella sp. 419]
MVQLSQVPLFRGDGSQDAEKWQQDFLLATAQFNDQAIARLFISKLARGSPAAEYINTLPSNTRASWLELDSAFQAKWLSGSTPDTNLGNRWDEFESHILTEESIFHGASSMDDGLTFDQRVLIWADDHIRLGKATGGSDESLIRLTKSRLPLFVLTALSMSPPPTSFTDFCDSITQIPPDILEMHRVQHQDHSSREARLSAIEKTLEGISTKIDRLLKGDSNIPVLAHGDSSDDRVAQPGHTHIDSPANELRSPIPSSGIPEAIMVNIPSQWRKPEMNLSKLEQIGVAQRAIDELMRHATNQHDFNGLSDAQTAGAWAVLAIHSQFVPLTKDNKNSAYLPMLLGGWFIDITICRNGTGAVG